ncbi:MAG: hypothetical protein WKF89_00705 [Chitinophagaceae bacterium]
MKGLKQKSVILLVVMISAMVGFFKGPQAKQKWAIKVKSKSDHRRQMAEKKSIERSGGVLLDDIEMASYHS